MVSGRRDAASDRARGVVGLCVLSRHPVRRTDLAALARIDMMRFAWRWAQIGDRVHVHHREAPHTLMPGVVTRVRRFPRRTEVAIRLDDEISVQRFARQYVHSDPKDPAEPCPLCPAPLTVPTA